MREKLKLLLKWAATFLICFLIVYLAVFFGGWKLFESGDPILIEVGVAYVLSIFVFMAYEVIASLEKRVKALEDRIKEPEKR